MRLANYQTDGFYDEMFDAEEFFRADFADAGGEAWVTRDDADFQYGAERAVKLTPQCKV
mgnify:CR=1 FL=1